MRRNPPTAEKLKRAIKSGTAPRPLGIARFVGSFLTLLAGILFVDRWVWIGATLDHSFEAIADERDMLVIGFSRIMAADEVIAPLIVLTLGQCIAIFLDVAVAGNNGAKGWMYNLRRRTGLWWLEGSSQVGEGAHRLRAAVARSIRIVSSLLVAGFISLGALVLSRFVAPSILLLAGIAILLCWGFLCDVVSFRRQRAVWYRSLYMDDSELRRELRENEGDPYIRRALRDGAGG